MRLRLLPIMIIVAFAGLPPATANADPIIYSSRAAFAAAVSGEIVEGWDTLPHGTVITSLNGVTYKTNRGDAVVTGAYAEVSFPNTLGATTLGFFGQNDTILFTFDSPVTAFGISVNSESTRPGNFAATTNLGDDVLSSLDRFPRYTTGHFIGFSSMTPFNSVRIRATASGFGYALDDLTYLPAEATAPVPEPASMILVATGLAAAGARRWRQRRS